VGPLPLLPRQHRWHPAPYPDGNCCRCDLREPETWDHLLHCPANAADVLRTVKEATIDAAKDTVVSINKRRLEQQPPLPGLSVGAVAFAAVPDSPAHDTGFLLGLPGTSVRDDLRRLGVRRAEADGVITAASNAALDGIIRHIWRPRCQETKDTIGSWKQRLAAASRQDLPRSRFIPVPPPAAAPPRSSPGRIDRHWPAISWTDANRLAFHTDRYRPVVDPSWCP
jgi:hypothetical protein